MQGVTPPLWPIHLKPLPDELLSCWLVRLAHGHGLKVQTFCNLIFGNKLQVWNRDIDRLAPAWLVDELAAKTGTPREVAYAATLRTYEGAVYRSFKASGALQWIQTLKMYHRKRTGYGLQFCGQCLSEKPFPYFRKHWRLSFMTVCPKHQTMLHDRCPQCGTSVAFHRIDMEFGSLLSDQAMALCHVCRFNLCESPRIPILSYEPGSSRWHAELCRTFSGQGEELSGAVSLDQLKVLRHMVRLLCSRYKGLSLHAHVCEKVGAIPIDTGTSKLPLETRPLNQRHHLILLASWLIVDLYPRLREAWLGKRVRYNHLIRDWPNPPAEYLEVVERFSDWHRRY